MSKKIIIRKSGANQGTANTETKAETKMDGTEATIIDVISNAATKFFRGEITSENALEIVPVEQHEELVKRVNELRAMALAEAENEKEKEAKRKATILALEGKSQAQAPLADMAVSKGYATLTSEGKLTIGKGTSWAQLYELAGQQLGVADFRVKKPTAVERRLIVTDVLSMVGNAEHSLSRPEFDVRLRHLNTHIQSCVTGYHKGTRNA